MRYSFQSAGLIFRVKLKMLLKLQPTSHDHGPCPTQMTSIPDINITHYSKVPCIMLSSNLSYTLIIALIPMYTLHLCISVFIHPLHPSHLCYPQLSCPCIPISLTHIHVSSVYKYLGSCMFLHLKYWIRLLVIVYTMPLHNLKHPIKLWTLNLLWNPSFDP